MNQRSGQALVEMVICSLILISVTSGFMAFSYWGVCRLWIDYQLYEGLICLAAREQPLQCKRTIEQNLNRIAGFRQIHSIRLYQTQESWGGEIEWRGLFGKMAIQRSLEKRALRP